MTCDAEGGKLEYRYTPAGLLSEVVNCATGRTLVSCTYDRSEQLLTETDGNGTKVQYTYDAWGRITEKTVYSVQGELAFQQMFSYENVLEDGTVLLKLTVTTRDETGNQTVCQYYDSRERLVRSTRGTEFAAYEYDYLDQVVSRRGYDGAATLTAYDPMGNVRSVTNPLGNTTRYTYDGLGHQRTQTDPLGNVFRTRVNALGLLVAKETPLPDGGMATERYWYDGAGNLTRVQDAEGGQIRYSYDPRNNLTDVVQPLSLMESFTTAYTYDREGRGCLLKPRMSTIRKIQKWV